MTLKLLKINTLFLLLFVFFYLLPHNFAYAQKSKGTDPPPKNQQKTPEAKQLEEQLKKYLQTNTPNNKAENARKKLAEVTQVLQNQYISEVDFDKLTEDAIKTMLKELDPHSVYFNAEDYKKTQEDLKGSFEGIGVQFNILDDTVTIVGVIGNGPSEKVGIMEGDKIVKVEDQTIAGVKIQNNDVMKKLRGPKNTKVKVGIKRSNEKELLDFVITRDKIPVYSLDVAYMATPNIGYIKLNKFAENTVKEFVTAFDSLKQHGLKDLILDLRNNGGGYLNTAVQLADQFLEADKIITYTQGKNSPRSDYNSTPDGCFEKGRLIVLINEGSASASEIVAGAIQDWDRGVVIGRRSFGKGLVQRPFGLTDGSFMRLTIAQYFVPSGRCIQKPYTEGSDAYDKEVQKRVKHGELYSKDSIQFPDSLKYQTLVKKRTVYGGGGIMPDIFVPQDTSAYSKYYAELLRKNIFNTFVYNHYIEKNKKNLEATYKNIADFDKQFVPNQKLLDDLVAFAQKEGVEQKEKEIIQSKPLIIMQLKALIGKQLFSSNNEANYRAYNAENEALKKAIEILQNGVYEKAFSGKY